MASKEKVLEVTGYELGAVSPFGLPTKMRILVDESVLAQEEVSLGSGVRGTTVFIQSIDLMKALGNIEIVKFREW
jgi:prolyl-tRNA editing enzyme YbaK/EbsC (Cys-tRNA(Pro) deacylase)